MTMEYDGVVYRTIQDVKDEFKVSEKALRGWVKKKLISEPPYVVRGGRRFRHYTDAWVGEFAQFLGSKHAKTR
jgi:DNA-binding transcriptional MerR regulator